MNTKDILSDDIKLFGSEEDYLSESLEFFYGSSEQIYVKPEGICICSIFEYRPDAVQVAKTDMEMATFSNLYTQIIEGNKRDEAAYDFFWIPKSEFLEKGLKKEELAEVIRLGLYLEYEGQFIMISNHFLQYLSKLFNMSEFEKGMNPIRDLYMANQLYDKNGFYMTVRKRKDVQKVFYASVNANCCASSKEICEKVVLHMKNKGAYVMRWEITQLKTEILFCFPEYSAEGFKFGVLFLISDTGEFAITLCNCVYADSQSFLMRDAILSRKNYSTFNVDAFLKEYDEKIYGLFKEYQQNIRQVPPADKLVLFKEYHELDIEKICGKKLMLLVRNAFNKEIIHNESIYRSYGPIIKLPGIASDLGAKGYIIRKLIKSIERLITNLVKKK